jgi:NAD(P)-dependent dehydrogenase (short-subunit alcohol dehydrogenase family)
MDLRLRGRTVVVTGASSGIGLTTVRHLVEEGARVVACARDLGRLEQAIGEIQGIEPGQVHLVSCDVTDRGQVERMVSDAVETMGGIDGLVCNAGRSLMAPLSETTDEQIREEIELKIFGAWNVIRAAGPALASSDAASVVVINAILAKQPETRLAVTSAARASLLNLTKTLSVELATEGVRVNSVCLGLVDTGQWRRRFEAADTELNYEQWSAQIAAERGIALGRFGTAEEVAFPIVSLLSPRSSYTTGISLDIGGGVARHV